MQDPAEETPRKKVTIRTFIEPLKLHGEKDILLNLVFGGVVYTIWSMVTSSTTGLFANAFGLNELQSHAGLGTIVGSAIVGKLMTRDYKTAELGYKTAHNLPPEHKLPAKDVPVEFPIEYARLRNVPWISVFFALSTSAYGLSLAFPNLTALPGWMALPLVFQFLIAATSNAVFAANQTLVSDLCPGKGASSTAINNLVRCGLGAVGVAFMEIMIAAARVGPTFVGLGLVVAKGEIGKKGQDEGGQSFIFLWDSDEPVRS
ncbi:hypothetical protein MKZ38_003333 [Zalerion maritima]|uniref:Uncharacterized protein n=1 Tax=Zalerion maritima TaxID=339359 RepID=A0AAD5RMS9_9PEZI|nr:hypothetical protein MKZ38_003333 [Zalerion maritima]